MPIRLLVVDDHVIIKDGLGLLCTKHPDVELAGEASNGQQVLATYEEPRPDVVVMDVGTPVMGGVTATTALLQRHPEANVVALSMHADPYYVGLMEAAGAVGYVLKDEASESLASAIRKVIAGQTAFPG